MAMRTGGATPPSPALWEERLREKRRHIISSLMGSDEAHVDTGIANQFLDRDRIVDFHRSLQSNGIYKISEKDTPLINQLKALCNVLTSIEKLGPELFRPLWNYIQTEGAGRSLEAWRVLVFSAVSNKEDAIQLFGKDLTDLRHYLNELNHMIESLPHIDESLSAMLIQVRDLLVENINPALKYMQSVSGSQTSGLQQANLQLCTAAQMLGQALSKTAPSAGTQQITNSTFDAIITAVRAVREAAGKLLNDKYQIVVDPKTGKYDPKVLKDTRLNEHERKTIKNIMHTSHIMSGIESALANMNQLLNGKSLQTKVIWDLLEQLGSVINEFDKIDIDMSTLRKWVLMH